MAHILFEHVNVDFPIYNAKNRSLKNKVMQEARLVLAQKVQLLDLWRMLVLKSKRENVLG